ncbi:cation:proton antiporter [Campylobacter sp. Cr9]|uniref:cation:proton antiporter n=1 Tax=unclassified Campylobacter TaxID=2593542 RepID=UPI001EFA3EF4|nr:cation:proton antiporter [Campylobacter sp. RM5004]MBZ7985627.1 cation:proton antiporter [Campylobacter sp. Cr9]ULO01913.1 potassium:proton antiporter [Campylobacter sp. RM5004]
MQAFLEIFLITSAIAIILNVVLKKFSIPTIIGYIATGFIIEEVFFVTASEQLSHIAEFGIVFLMFTIGLEFSIKHLLTMKTDVFVNGALQMGICGIVFAVILHHAFGIKDDIALIIGFTISLSSTAIVLKILNENQDINQRYGRKALGILLFQDIAVIPLLLMIDIFNQDGVAISTLVIKTLISAFIVLLLLFLIGKYIYSKVLYFVLKTNSQEIFIATILFTVVGASFLASFFGFSYSLGAFIAGMMIAETEFKHQIEADLIPFRDLLLGFFFITVGLQINIDVIIKYWYVIIALTIGIMLIKTLCIFLLLSIKSTKSDALKTALSVSQIGEFALAIFTLLVANKMLDSNTAQMLTLAVILSMILSPFILKNIKTLASITNDEIITVAPKIEAMSGHFVIFGYGSLGQEVVLRLKNQGIPYIVLENDMSLVELGQSRAENVYYASAEQTASFDNASIKTSAAVIVTISNEQVLEVVSKKILDYDPNANVIIRINKDEYKIFEDLGENIKMVKEEKVIARTLLQEALVCRIKQQS